MIGFSLLFVLLALDGSLGRNDGLVLVALLIAYTGFLLIQSRRQEATMQWQALANMHEDAVSQQLPKTRDKAHWSGHWLVCVVQIGAGLILLVVGSDLLVTTSSSIAKVMGVSDVIIGLTIVAAGTSMPEVATSVIATIKGERDLAVGNVVGSCIFNILACLGISSIVAPGGIPIPGSVMAFDLWVMLASALVCLPIFFSGREIARWEGLLLLGYYVAYTTYLILSAQNHSVLPLFSTIMLMFVLPLSGVALITSVWTVRKTPAGN
jgi:cation:H+ antiporter